MLELVSSYILDFMIPVNEREEDKWVKENKPLFTSIREAQPPILSGIE